MTLLEQVTLGLLAWSLLSLASAVVGLYALPRDFWRGFWFMTGIWGFIDGIIGVTNLVNTPISNQELGRLLLINAGLDLLYLLIGALLLTRTRPILRGFGWAIIFQGLFLLIFDLAFWWRVSGSAS